ncbi:MAG: sulfite exporter TauE/SafE family protein [SAR324 cluster bacterium]|nr:sulfite exporter TauE/SafE family protein [SAR324 cluster bacterium]
MDFLYILLLFVVGTVAGFTNVMAGGGSALSLPVLIFMGLDSALANGTNRVAICIQNIIAIWGFRQQEVSQFRESFRLAVFTLPGGALGAWAAVQMNDVWFQRVLAVVMVGIVISMLLPKFQQKETVVLTQRRVWLSYLAMFGIGFYGGFIQVGVGFLLMAVLYHVLNLSLVHVNMHKVFIVFIYTLPAIAVFIATGNVNWSLGLSLAAGNAAGGWIGSYATVKGGEKIIRYVLIVGITLMAIKLLNIF